MTAGITIPARFCGPPTSGNGGYSAGLIATILGAGLGDAVEVRLHVAPPLHTELTPSIDHTDPSSPVARLLQGDTVVLSGRPVEWPDTDVDPTHDGSPTLATWDEARAAAEHPPSFADHPFPTCFVCGPARVEGDGLRIFACPIPGRPAADRAFASCWTPDPTVADPDDPSVVQAEIVWAALDCPGGQALHVFAGNESAVVLGTITARRLAPVRVGHRYVVTSWEPTPPAGRKHFAAAVLTDARTGAVIGESRSVWIAVPRT